MHFSSLALLLSAISTCQNFVTAIPLNDTYHELEARTTKTVTYDCGASGTPQICLNTCWAVNCWGLPETLHGGKGVDSDANRKSWGYGQKSKWKQYIWNNDDCSSPEEYPYASSKEGGLDGAGKTLALRCVPIAKQRSECFHAEYIS